MAIYAIGDLQGCFDELIDLLNEINFDESHDQLWFAGDIINRGPKSLECLEFVFNNSSFCKTVLGNHDLHFIALAHGVRKPHKSDTLNTILNTTKRDEFINWYRQQPLLLKDDETQFHLIHAGIPPQWDITLSIELAQETSAYLQSKQFNDFIHRMYGNEPLIWNERLQGFERYRFIINCFTRLRYCNKDGSLEFNYKGSPGSQNDYLFPWYSHRERKTKNNKILFGHWSTVTLGKDKDFSIWNAYPLDTGCLWGGQLTALRLLDEKIFSVPSRQINKN